jgi:NhaA family Na+:H+ antiporter
MRRTRPPRVAVRRPGLALFISGLAFPGALFESEAKLAILLGSLLAATVGIAVLLTMRPIEPDSS